MLWKTGHALPLDGLDCKPEDPLRFIGDQVQAGIESFRLPVQTDTLVVLQLIQHPRGGKVDREMRRTLKPMWIRLESIVLPNRSDEGFCLLRWHDFIEGAVPEDRRHILEVRRVHHG